MKILEIVPRLHPDLCGVGDYSLGLAKEWKHSRGLDTEFLVGDPGWAHGSSVDGFAVRRLLSRSHWSLGDAIKDSECDAVVLQYSGYGFHKRGAPLWLLNGLSRHRRVPVLTMFHELYATGPIYSSAFWLSPAMRLVARRLAMLSSHVWTNRKASADWLEACIPSVKSRLTVLPVFSSLGELQHPGGFHDRQRWLAIFAYQAGNNPLYWDQLRQVISVLRPTKVVSLGRKTENLKNRCGNVPYEQTGIVSAEVVSRWLANCQFGYVSYSPAYLAKSSILATCLAHGLCTLLAGNACILPDGLEYGKQVLPATAIPPESDFEEVAIGGMSWYGRHNRAATALSYANAILRLVG